MTNAKAQIAAWQHIANDPSAAYQDPVQIRGIHPMKENIEIKLLITRERADKFMDAPDLEPFDVLIVSATCWDREIGEQVETDITPFLAHIDRLLSTEHALTSVDYSHMSDTPTAYRLIFVDSDQRPVRAQAVQG
ncbi:hypothetical protein G7068_13875 [Leucobacter viscericola]|uniref:Uncharacterized protein n=1 Tax=Leucobacter viscericola TaxID=2714935 RepID=A0A6G7XI59_9MICO|nr:hypothetical protein [Leucobacter viscericola]QIK64166.1 hypothetical protein G7068_13875 [Leucobacter viscericola]